MSNYYIASDNGYGIITVRDTLQQVVAEFTYSKNDDGTVEIFDAGDWCSPPVSVVAAGQDYLRAVEAMMEYAEVAA